MPNDTTRWTVSVSKDTDIAVRGLLGQRGVKKGGLSNSSKTRRVLEQTMAEGMSLEISTRRRSGWMTAPAGGAVPPGLAGSDPQILTPAPGAKT